VRYLQITGASVSSAPIPSRYVGPMLLQLSDTLLDKAKQMWALSPLLAPTQTSRSGPYSVSGRGPRDTAYLSG
jgi:hypothetical protein